MLSLTALKPAGSFIEPVGPFITTVGSFIELGDPFIGPVGSFIEPVEMNQPSITACSNRLTRRATEILASALHKLQSWPRS